MKSRISGKDATYVAREALKRRPIRLMAPEGVEEPPSALVPFEDSEQAREAPPRVLKPSALNDQCVAPTPDLESHRKRLREAFGNTLSDEFVEVLLGKLVEALRPAALESLEESTVNAATLAGKRMETSKWGTGRSRLLKNGTGCDRLCGPLPSPRGQNEQEDQPGVCCRCFAASAAGPRENPPDHRQRC